MVEVEETTADAAVDVDDPDNPAEGGVKETKAEKIERSRKKWVRGFDHVLPIDHTHGNFKGPIEKLVSLLEDDKLDPNEKDVMGLRPLHKAAARGYAQAIAVLLDHGADINAQDNLGMTPLAKCTTKNADGTFTDKPECAEAKALLIERGAKDIPAPRARRFRYDPTGHSYWTWAEDENGRRYSYDADDESGKNLGRFHYSNWDACTEEIDPPPFLGKTKEELAQQEVETKAWQKKYREECEERRRKEKEAEKEAEEAQKAQQAPLAQLLAALAQASQQQK